MTFTHLMPGRTTLSVTAPNYADAQLPLRLRPGRNAIAKPIDMVGLAIPGLDSFTMVETPGESALRIEMRPVASDGSAIVNHPCIDLWVGARVSAEVANGELARDPDAPDLGRGATLFNGRIAWTWDSDPTASFRYIGTIPYASLTARSAPLWVIDYLVVVPDPRKMSSHDLETMMKNAPEESDPAVLKAFLDGRKVDGRFQYFLTTSWNVKNLPPQPAAS